MAEVFKARCPYCKCSLRIPAKWTGRVMRCKHCKKLFKARNPSAGTGIISAETAAKGTSGPILRIGDPPKRRKKVNAGRWLRAVIGILLVVTSATALVVAGPTLLELVQGTPKVAQGDKQPPKANTVTNDSDSKGRSNGSGVVPSVADEDATKEGEPNKSIPGTKPAPKKTGPVPPKNAPPKVKPTPKKPTPTKRPPARGLYPRRALLVSVNDYLLANPLNYGEDYNRRGFPGSNAAALAYWLTHFRMKFPRTQVYELSDYAQNSPAPLKSVIETTITKFLNTSRPQDRIVLLFSGHAVEMDEEAYLVPIEGDLEDPATLIPLSWVYKQLEACPARQKVLIVDVCRTDPARGNERPGGSPMGETLFKQLKNPPAGVQVWSSCSLDQNSLEFEKGSLFIEALCAAMWKRLKGIQTPEDPIPLDQLRERVNEYLSQRLKGSELKQMTFIAGRELPGADYDPSEALPARFSIEAPALAGGKAGHAVVKSILDEINSAPPPRSNRSRTYGELRYGALPPFEAKVLEEYKQDGYTSEMEFLRKKEKYPLRAAIVQAKLIMQKFAKSFQMKEYFDGNSSAQVKQQVLRELEKPGKAIFFLKDEALETLLQAQKYLDKEPSKRWKAHYYYVLARLKSRLLYLMEYETVLAKIRTDDLPPLRPGETGYRLASRRRLSSREEESRAWRSEVRDLWDKIIEDFPGTPWAVLARRERTTNLGLEWRPTRD